VAIRAAVDAKIRSMPERTIHAAALQWDVERGDVAHNLKAALDLIATAATDGAEVVVLPEMWASSFCGDAAASMRAAVAAAESRLLEVSGDRRLVVVGSNYDFGADGSIGNRALLMDRGRVVGSYRKMHLFSPHGEDDWFTGGTTALVADTSVGRVGVVICYDLRFPELVRWLFLQGAELLLVPAQWPEAREAHWRILVRARAVEDQCFVVAANRCGVEPSLVTSQDVVYPGNSLIVDPTGTIVAGGSGAPGVIAAEIELRQAAAMRRAIPVAKDRRPDAYAALWDGPEFTAASGSGPDA
jgi:predicted amidohydrolase